MAQTATTQSAREASLARRRATSTTGKAALATSTNTGAAGAVSQGRDRPVAAPVSRPVSKGPVGRAASRERRQLMSTNGKAGLKTSDRIREYSAETAKASAETTAPVETSGRDEATTGNAASKTGCGCGCNGTKATCNSEPALFASDSALSGRTKTSATVIADVRRNISRGAARAASLSRREAMSSRGKAGIGKGSSAASSVRAANPHLSSRDLAKSLREQRSKSGRSGEKKSQPCGRMRTNSKNGAAEDAPWKVGASETFSGQTLTGTMVGRSEKMTGDEPSTCREITGTEYMGADVFRAYCQADPAKKPRKVEVTSTSHGNSVSGNKMGRGSSVTGNEQGTCKRVTGNEYISSEQSQGYCAEFAEKSPRKASLSETMKGKKVSGNNVGRSDKVTGDEPGSGRQLTGTQYMQTDKTGSTAPAKVGQSKTLRGGTVSGSMLGRSERVTGDEPGSCRNVTGDDYLGQEQYSGFCNKTPKPEDKKVGESSTLNGKVVTGTMADRSGKVTGDEPGTCKTVTGTPYASADQYTKFCKPEEAQQATARTKQLRGTPGSVMTGIQPAIGGVMTGDSKGACENVSGTPYIGADQFAEACPATAATTASPDFPQTMGQVPWGQFSVTQPSGGAQMTEVHSNVTGSSYEKGHITGPFDMATGKVTGTEEARFGMKKEIPATPVIAETATMVEGRVKSRISGEGMDAGYKITGDDWDRGDNVTGTEGLSATKRNPTIHARGVMPSAAMLAAKRNQEVPEPVSKVTGGSGNTEKGSLVTYSGGARG